MEETPVDCINRLDMDDSALPDRDQDLITVSGDDIHNHEGYNPHLPGYMRPLRRSPSNSVENPAPGTLIAPLTVAYRALRCRGTLWCLLQLPFAELHKSLHAFERRMG